MTKKRSTYIAIDEAWLRKEYKKGRTMIDIGKELGVSKSTIGLRMKEFGIKTRFAPCGEDNPVWKGGKTIHEDGYIQIRCTTHPRAHQSGYVFEHILVMEEHLGRYITLDEKIHHIDYDKSNNNIGNLALLESRSAHNKIVKSLYNLIPKLLDKCLIYNKKDNKYYEI
ncbi:hypothetical protein LCGC14_0223990 [marine sediment metagenome]|uniref:HNH nuclease domain-containing protein n=1 Tax=marine sediment metagenome TaxID=412755 RepID=A0A0F9WWR7_9ZZZZ